MPIQLDDLANLASAPAAKAVSPKYFSPELTGSGKAVGLLNQNVHPGRYALGSNAGTMPQSAVSTKSKNSGNSLTTFTIPMAPLTQYSLEHNANGTIQFDVPFDNDRLEITAHATKLDFDVFLDLTPQGVMLVKDESGDTISRELNILYRMELVVLAKGSTSERTRLVRSAPYLGGRPFAATDEFTMLRWSYAPLDDIEEFIADATSNITSTGNSVYVDIDEVAEWMADYDVHERICRLAAQWSGDGVAEIIADHITQLFAAGTPDDKTLGHLAMQLRYLETYNVTLQAYRTIHAAIDAACQPDIALTLSKQNLNLLMSHTLEQLSAVKDQLAVPSQTGSGNWTPAPYFSAQQRAAISTPGACTLVQAGAGTGKSTVILERIQFLEAHGVDPKDIMVLSFTNAAADNILAKNPNVGSMTIASMIHQIYALNHPTHQLSQIDTILNCLDIDFPNDDAARAFRKILLDVKKNTPGATTLLNAFLEKHGARALEILDKLGQTCLELEIVMAYQGRDTMVEPAELNSKFLIIDEVQDNSIFEFIYLLTYVTKHRENMFIVGDASQTLYEFRSSNPKALNALEESGVFDTFQLTTNYRSNQEILDFANVHLADIEANRAAQLRLQANSLAAPTAKSFQDKVTLNYQHTRSLNNFTKEELGTVIGAEVRPYIEACLSRGEQVAFLAHTKREIAAVERKLKEMFPSQHVANLISNQVYATTVFSQYIKMYWNDVLQVDPADASFVVHKGVNENLQQLTRNADAAAAPVAKMTSEWWLASGTSINGWVGLYQAGQLTAEAFFEQLKRNLLDYEINHNAVKAALMNQKNRERKEMNVQAQSRLVVSTIHGAKGLEFDNVVVVHKFTPQMDEADKRMHYVAFTRAMKSEYILSYGTAPKPRIEADYQMLVGALERRDTVTALQASGVDIDALSEEDLNDLIARASADATDDVTTSIAS